MDFRTEATHGPAPSRTRRLPTRFKKPGNVILLADATFVGETDGRAAMARPGISPRRTRHSRAPCRFSQPAHGAGGFRSGTRPQLFQSRSGRPGAPLRCRSSEPATARCRRSGLRRALRAAGIAPSAVRIDGTLLMVGDRLMPLENAAGEHRGRRDELCCGL